MMQDAEEQQKPVELVASFWSQVDAIVVINLDFRPDRWERFLNEVSGGLPKEKLHRLSAVEGRKLPGYGEAPWFTERTGERSAVWGGTGGCALSHRNAIALAKEKGWRNALVLEDDVQMQPLSEASACLLSQAMHAIDGKPAMLYLGFNKPVPYGCPFIKGEGGETIWKIDGVLAAHSYIVTAELYDTLLERLPLPDTIWPWLARYRAVDTFYRDYVPALPGVGIYAIVPFIFRQAGGESNISQGYDHADSFICNCPPHSLCSWKGMWHLLSTPLRRLKISLNAQRTYRRAVTGGLPGKRRRK